MHSARYDALMSSPLLRRLASLSPYFQHAWLPLSLAVVGAAISALCESGIGWLMMPLVDGGFHGAPVAWLAQLPRPPLWVIPITLVTLFFVRGIAGFIVDYAMSFIANRATMSLRAKLFDRLLDADASMFTARSASSLTNTVVYEAVHGIALLTGAAQTLMKDVFTTAVLFATLLLLNWKLTLVIVALAPVLGVTMRAFTRRMHRITKAAQLAVDRLGYVVEENILAWRVIRLHGQQRRQATRFHAESRSLYGLLMKSTVASAAATPLIQLFTAIALALIIAVALWQSSRDGTTIGSFIAFITMAISIATPIRRLTEVTSTVTRGLAAVERGLDLIRTAPMETGGTHTALRTTGHLVLRGVDVQFGDEAKALCAIDLDVKPGSVVALVGPSGAGKTTLVNLVPRFLAPTAGTIELDGVRLEDWDIASLRAQIALVSQDVVLLNGSVAENVSLGDASDPARVTAALQAANLLDVVRALPDGLDTPIGHNGARLSGGQRQRLAIARAIYKNAPIIILDEATSALDSESERLIQEAMTNLMQGRTSIVIAHRFSTIANADRVVVLDAGRIVESGRHDELLARGGLYAKLHDIQFGRPVA